LVAGVNAALRAGAKEPDFVLSRLDGYIGVLIDDLVTKGADEPYRMFTSRAEYRLLLREDNADLRLSEIGYKYGLLDENSYRRLQQKRESIEFYKNRLQSHAFFVAEETNRYLEERKITPLKERVLADILLRRPGIGWKELCDLGFDGKNAQNEVAEQVVTQIKYAGYIKRDTELLHGMQKNERLRIPKEIDFDKIPGLSSEIRQRLRLSRPETVGQASRLCGVTPAAMANLVIFLTTKELRARVINQNKDHEEG